MEAEQSPLAISLASSLSQCYLNVVENKNLNLFISNRAQISLEHLQPKDQFRVLNLIQRLCTFPFPPDLQRKIFKLPARSSEQYYVGRAGVKYRVIFFRREDAINVVEIVDHDRLDRFESMLTGGGRQ